MRFSDTIKDPAVEEWIDFWWHRRLAFPVARLAYRLGMTPTQVTLGALLVGVAGAGACFAARVWSQPLGCVLGGILVLSSVVLDCADGMLARMRGGGTKIGMLLDGAADWIVGLSFAVGFAWAMAPFLTHSWEWLLIAAIFVSLAFQVTVYDAYKNAFLCGVAEDVPDPTNRREPQVTSRDAEGRHGGAEPRIAVGLEGLLLRLYDLLYGAAERRVLASRLPVSAPLFRAAMEPVMRVISWLGLGSTFFVIYASAVLFPLAPKAVLLLGTVAFVLVRNGIVLWSGRAWRRRIESLRQSAVAA